jgi:small-conductance mechanosensitive channel
MVNLAVDETSGVDHPAHLHEGWIVFKSADGTGVIDAITEEVDPNTQENEEVVEDTQTEEVNESAVELEKAVARIAELEQALAVATEPVVDETSEDALMKSAPAAVVAMLEKARKDADAVREELAKERTEKRDREFIAKAAEFSFLAINADEFGPALRQISDINPELALQMEKALASANAQAESAEIFAELGHSKSAGNTSAYNKVESLAKAAHAKGEYATVEQAVVGLISTDPELYAQYRSERNA